MWNDLKTEFRSPIRSLERIFQKKLLKTNYNADLSSIRDI